MEELSGHKCIGLISRDFWLGGKLESDPIALFLYTARHSCYIIYLDDEDNIWKVEKSDEQPTVDDILGSGEFKYKHKDIASKYDLKGKEIVSVHESDKGTNAEAILKFDDGSVLRLLYTYKTEDTLMTFHEPNKL